MAVRIARRVSLSPAGGDAVRGIRQYDRQGAPNLPLRNPYLLTLPHGYGRLDDPHGEYRSAVRRPFESQVARSEYDRLFGLPEEHLPHGLPLGQVGRLVVRLRDGRYAALQPFDGLWRKFPQRDLTLRSHRSREARCRNGFRRVDADDLLDIGDSWSYQLGQVCFTRGEIVPERALAGYPNRIRTTPR